MKDCLLEINKVGTRNPFGITIEAPEKDSASGDYFCRVLFGGREPSRMEIFGVSRQQAVRLAVEVTAARITHILCSQEIDEPDGEKGRLGTNS